MTTEPAQSEDSQEAAARIAGGAIADYLKRAYPAVLEAADGFTCPACGRTSHHPADVEHGYCGACHDFTGNTRRDHETGCNL